MSASKKKPPEQVSVEKLNTLFVSLTPLRFKLAQLQKEGWDIYPLGELLELIKETIKEDSK